MRSSYPIGDGWVVSLAKPDATPLVATETIQYNTFVTCAVPAS